MPQYIFVYLGGELPDNPEEGQNHFQRYQQWLDSLEEALAAARSCPFLEINGTLEVSEMIEMSGQQDDQASGKLN